MSIEIREDGYPRISCAQPGCRHAANYGGGFEGPAGLEESKRAFQRHVDQHAPGRTPDIYLTLTATGWCSACGRGITCEVDEDEMVRCSCGASWDTYGLNGRTDRELEA